MLAQRYPRTHAAPRAGSLVLWTPVDRGATSSPKARL